jgi:hypothetical protein
MPVLPQLEFVLLPGTEEKLSRGLIRLDRVARKIQNSAHSEDVARKALEEWNAGNLDYFQSGTGLNRLISLLVNEASLAAEMNFQEAISTCIKRYSSKTAVYGLMGWCKTNWNQSHISFYREQLELASDDLQLLPNGVSKLKYGLGPLLGLLIDRDGAEDFAANALKAESGWNGYISQIKLRDSEISGDFFKSASKNYMLQLLGQNQNLSRISTEALEFLERVNDSNLKKSLLYLTSLTITVFDEKGLDHEALQKLTLETIGEINSSAWLAVDNLSLNEKATVERAREIVESWITELFLERFWNLIDDTKRRRFWTKYQKHMRDVRLAISDRYWANLPEDLRSIQYKSRLHATSDNALLIFRIKHKTFIEFGERASGPLQVIDNSSRHEDALKRSLAGSIRTKRAPQHIYPQDLKFYSKTDQILIDSSGRMRDFGKLNHAVNWEKRLARWMRQKGL